MSERKKLVCDRCGSNKFKLVVEQVISDVFRADDDPIADRTIEEENIISIVCLKCGKKLYENPAPTCPKCGTPLEKRKFVDSWDAQGNPMDIHEDWYCRKCDIRWMYETGPHEFYEE